MRKKGTEGGFSDRIRKALKDAGAFVRKIPSDKYSSGLPDWMIIHKGLTAFAELKKEDQNLTLLQRLTMKDIAKAGGLSIRLRINQQEGCDVSYVDSKGIIVPVSTCRLEHICEAINLANIMFRSNVGPISGQVDNFDVTETTPKLV